MLQSHAKQLQIKYMTVLRRETELRPEDLGAVRLAIGMALGELQDEHRQQLNDMDDIIADLLEQWDQLKVVTAADAGEILRLQTCEDRLVSWVMQNEPVNDTSDIAYIVIDILEKYRRNGGTLVAPSTNGNGHGTVKITNLATRYTGRRLNMTDDELRTLAMTKIRQLAAELGRTPTKKDWNDHIQPDEPSLTTLTYKLHKPWNQLIADAGLTPNLNSHQRAAQIAAEQQEEEAPADNASSTFRSQ